MSAGTPPPTAPHPGQLLRQLLDERGWTIAELADITGFARSAFSGILTGKGGISAEMAVALGAALGNDPAEWMRWNAAHQLSLVTGDAAEVEARAKFFNFAPVRDMERRGWIKPTKTTEELQRELERFYGGSLDGDTLFSVATMRSDPLAKLTPAERAWCVRARQLAENVPVVAAFDESRMPAAIRKLRILAMYPKEAERLPEMLAYYGIRFVVVEPLPNTKIDGAAFWIEDSPVIAVSARWDRIDAFWFTVMHECMHIKNRDTYSVDVNLLHDSDHGIVVAVSDDAVEQLANEQAADVLIPKSDMDAFVRRTSPFYAVQKIVQFAHRIKMHPGVIVGQLQHRGELRYSAHRDFLVKVRQFVIDTALTDGWGRELSPSV